jgi:hypothetical protein
MSTAYLFTLLAVICFVIAALPHKLTIRPEWLGAALFVARLLVVVSLVVTVLSMTACATVDSFNKVAADVTHEAIVASEQHRCTVHAQPCLSDEQFRAVNAELHKVSVAGVEFTKLRIAGKASIADAQTFLAVVAEETGVLSKTFTNGSISAVLAKLTELQAKAVQLLGN